MCIRDRLNTRTGQNHIDANNLKATALESSTVETKPMIGLDVAAVGGMYANHITMVGTEAGVGVNLNGVVAGTQSVSVDANGHLSVNGMLQSDTSLVAKANSIPVSYTHLLAVGTTVIMRLGRKRYAWVTGIPCILMAIVAIAADYENVFYSYIPAGKWILVAFSAAMFFMILIVLVEACLLYTSRCV